MEYLITGIKKLIADIYFEGDTNIAEEELLNGGCYELVKIIKNFIPNEVSMRINATKDHCVLAYDGYLYDASGIIRNTEDFKIPSEKDLNYINFRFGKRVKSLQFYQTITKEIEKIGISEFIKQTIREENGKNR